MTPQQMITNAFLLAQKGHQGQVRKYNGNPYITHPVRVALHTTEVMPYCADAVAAAFMHDLLEDTQITLGSIIEKTNKYVGGLVLELTNPSKNFPNLSREDRKTMDRNHLKNVSVVSQNIKLIDRIDNIQEMELATDSFKKLYCHESKLLVEALKFSEYNLSVLLMKQIDKLESTIAS